MTDMKQDFNKCMVSPIGFKVNKFSDRSTRVKLSSFFGNYDKPANKTTDIRGYRKVILQIINLCEHSINGSKFISYSIILKLHGINKKCKRCSEE